MGRRKKGLPINGWLCVDKPAGPTSSDVVNKLRRAFDAQKAGHGGTLDPLATGILPVAFGEATKTVPNLMDADKVYRFTARWGEARATDDAEGEVVATSAVRPDADAIRAALPAFEGEIWQKPPAFSAIKVDGERAYDLARAGEAVDLVARPVYIARAELIEIPDGDHAVFEIECGKGTYVRSFVRDLAKKLGTEGFVASLRRTRVGPFDEMSAVTLDHLLALVHSPAAETHLLPVETPLDDIPAVPITDNDAGRLRNGQAIFLRAGMNVPKSAYDADEEPVFLCTLGRGRPVAVCTLDAGQLRPVRVFNL